ALPAGFIYNTEPACRALVVARQLDAARAWSLVRLVQEAFYTQAVDVTQGAALLALAERAGYTREAFQAAFVSAAAHAEVAGDFAWAGGLGISGFPTLLAERNGMLALLCNGYQPGDRVVPLLTRWVAAGEASRGAESA